MQKAFSFLVAVLSVWLCLSSCVNGQKKQTRDEMVVEDRDNMSDDDFWIYDNFEKAIEVAKTENKPIMVVLRCIP